MLRLVLFCYETIDMFDLVQLVNSMNVLLFLSPSTPMLFVAGTIESCNNFWGKKKGEKRILRTG